jgi:hypothetical protein
VSLAVVPSGLSPRTAAKLRAAGDFRESRGAPIIQVVEKARIRGNPLPNPQTVPHRFRRLAFRPAIKPAVSGMSPSPWMQLVLSWVYQRRGFPPLRGQVKGARVSAVGRTMPCSGCHVCARPRRRLGMRLTNANRHRVSPSLGRPTTQSSGPLSGR